MHRWHRPHGEERNSAKRRFRSPCAPDLKCTLERTTAFRLAGFIAEKLRLTHSCLAPLASKPTGCDTDKAHSWTSGPHSERLLFSVCSVVYTPIGSDGGTAGRKNVAGIHAYDTKQSKLVLQSFQSMSDRPIVVAQRFSAR